MKNKFPEVTITVFGQNVENKTTIEIKPEDLEVLKEVESVWPVEMDTLDLREHEFNFKK